MIVTQDNFESVLPRLKESVLDADFITFDTEFSGYSKDLSDKGHDYDTIDERYLKLKTVVSQFLAFQFGLCTFKWCSKQKKYTYQAFSFYVFPNSKIGLDSTFLFQADAINFLSRKNFDFNKAIQSGITFHPLEQSQRLKIAVVDKLMGKKPQDSNKFSCLSEKHNFMLENFMRQIEEFVYDPNSGKELVFEIHSQSLKKALSKEVTKVYNNTGVFTEFQRNLPQTRIKKAKQFKQKNFLRGYANDRTDPEKICTDLGFQTKISESAETTISPQQLKKAVPMFSNEESKDCDTTTITPRVPCEIFDKLPNELKEQAWQLFEQERGFCRLLDILKDYKKPLVGHNMSFDLGFLSRQLIGDLPQTFKDWSIQLKEYLPEFFDTKVLTMEFDEKDNLMKCDLEYLFRKCTKDKKFNNSISFEPFSPEFDFQQNQAHDACFDAYMTGVVFATLTKYIEIGAAIQQKQKHFQQLQNQPLALKYIKQYVNRVMCNVDTRQTFSFQKNASLSPDEVLNQKRIQNNCIQIELWQNGKNELMDITEIASFFRKHGDIQIQKQQTNIFWIDFQEFMDEKETIENVIKQAEALQRFTVRRATNAIRFEL